MTAGVRLALAMMAVSFGVAPFAAQAQTDGMLPPIGFKSGSVALPDSAKSVLSRTAKTLADNPRLNLFIVGHSDASGTATMRNEIAQRRAAEVGRALVALGVDPKRLAIRSAGASAPKASDSTAMGRAENRRVELVPFATEASAADASSSAKVPEQKASAQPPAAAAAPTGPTVQSGIDRHEIEKIVRDYLVANPEVLEEATAELNKRQALAEAAKQTAGVKKNAEQLFQSPRGVIVGGRDGDVNFVEFFDYNCGFCKRAMADMLDLMKEDPKLRVTLKEFPVLGQGSIEAAQVAVAVRMQDASGKKYLDFHQKLLGARGQVDKQKALGAAKEAGLDMARLEKDLASPEVKATITENFKMAEDMGLNGTPSYVIGEQVVVGAIGLEQLKEKIAAARRTAER